MIPFKYGTQEQYDISIKDNRALYFISDTKRIYRGEEQIAGIEVEVVNTLPLYNSAKDGIIYVLETENNACLYVKGPDRLIKISGNVDTHGITDVDAFAPDMVVKSEDDLELAPDNAVITAGILKKALDDATGSWEYLDGTTDTDRIYG